MGDRHRSRRRLQRSRAWSVRRTEVVLHFECVGRGKVVLQEDEKVQLIKTLQKDIGEHVPWIGFYTYGEIGPIESSNSFHNFTAAVAAVY